MLAKAGIQNPPTISPPLLRGRRRGGRFRVALASALADPSFGGIAGLPGITIELRNELLRDLWIKIISGCEVISKQNAGFRLASRHQIIYALMYAYHDQLRR
jgi:hypothetical protein